MTFTQCMIPHCHLVTIQILELQERLALLYLFELQCHEATSVAPLSLRNATYGECIPRHSSSDGYLPGTSPLSVCLAPHFPNVIVVKVVRRLYTRYSDADSTKAVQPFSLREFTWIVGSEVHRLPRRILFA